jgi:hypothetical protein
MKNVLYAIAFFCATNFMPRLTWAQPRQTSDASQSNTAQTETAGRTRAKGKAGKSAARPQAIGAAGAYWFVLDIKDPKGSLKICTEQAVANHDTAHCPEWDNTKSFFRSGSVLHLLVMNAKFRSTFNLVINDKTLTDNVPEVRGVNPPSPAKTEQALGKPPPPQNPESEEQAKAFKNILLLYEQTRLAIGPVESYEGPYESQPTPGCDVRGESPDGGTLPLLAFAETLYNDAIECSKESTGRPFRKEDVFNDLTNRTDELRQSAVSLEAALPSQDALTKVAADVHSKWNAFSNAAKAFAEQYRQPTMDEARYLAGGDMYDALWNESAIIGNEKVLLDAKIFQVFGVVNWLYEQSESPRPIDLPINQYITNDTTRVQVPEVPGFVPYTFPLSKPSPSDGANPKQGVKAPVDPAAGKKPSKSTNKGTTDTPSPGASDNAAYSFNFNVHKFYRANLVAGFFVSSLRTRQYGITNNGQATSSTNVTFVTVTGPTYRPQYHAFVGIDIYPWQRDVFPGALSKQGFLSRNWHPLGLNAYWNPGILVGYGVDSPNNYIVGLNWETTWGINFGPGWHIGQEAYLQPGIVPGLTQLPSSATSAPTFNRTRYGWYGSVGFDLAVMKNAISQLFK